MIPESRRVRTVVLAGLRKMSRERSNAESYEAIVPELSEQERDEMAVWLAQSIAEGYKVDLGLPVGGELTVGEVLVTALVTGVAVGREIERAGFE